MTWTVTQTADATWITCVGCRQVIYRPRFEREHAVCPHCGQHGRIDAARRLGLLLDEGSARAIDAGPGLVDPLRFVDEQPYTRRIAEARDATGMAAAVQCVRGTIGGHPVVLAAMDFRFLGGSLGTAEGELVTAAAEAALADHTPLVLVTASGGARMQEGALALMMMAKISQALAALDEAGVLTVAVITDPTYGGVAASFATACDVIVAEAGARLGFAGPRVIEQTIREQLPHGFQTAEFLLRHGLIDVVRQRAAIRDTLAQLLAAARPGRLARGEVADSAARLAEEPSTQDPWDAVRMARDTGRPTTTDYAAHLLDSFVELHGDRMSGDCPSVVGGVGSLDGLPVVVIGHQKGHGVKELVERNFGMASPSGYRKAARLMRLAAKVGLPVITLVDTPGAYPGIAAEQTGQAFAISDNLRLMASLPVPVVTVITGEGGSGGALALSVADQVLIMRNAVYSVISPEGCAAILWRSKESAPQAARALKLDADSLLRLGVVDGIVPEPPGGSQADHLAASELLKAELCRALMGLMSCRPAELVARRRARFRAFGRGWGSEK